jgi:hypothetical protein
MFGRPEHHLSGEISFLKESIKDFNLNISIDLKELQFAPHLPLALNLFLVGNQLSQRNYILSGSTPTLIFSIQDVL